MASLRLSTLQSLVRGTSTLQRFQQRRWAQVHDVRFLATHHDPQHVQDRYRSKLDQKAKQEGHESIESLKEAYQDKIEALRKKASTVATPESPSTGEPAQTQTKTQTAFTPPPPPSPQSPQAQAIASATESNKSSGIKPLSSYLDVEKVRDLPPQELEAVWRLRHAKNPRSICACIPIETYRRIAAAAKENPQFILPLPRQTGEQESSEGNNHNGGGGKATSTAADIHFLQWAFHPPPSSSPSPGNTHTSTVIFTHLAAYKNHGSFAQPHTTLTHHLDLAHEKGLVLMHGQVMPDSGVSAPEASWLANCVQRFYDFGGQAEGRKGELVRMFTRGDVEGFRVEALLDEAERL